MEIKKLRPLSEYIGPVLKLTPKDKANISKMEVSIVQLECDICDINKQLEKSSNVAYRRDYFYNKIEQAEAYIADFKDKIREIKISRLNKQKAKV